MFKNAMQRARKAVKKNTSNGSVDGWPVLKEVDKEWTNPWTVTVAGKADTMRKVSQWTRVLWVLLKEDEQGAIFTELRLYNPMATTSIPSACRLK